MQKDRARSVEKQKVKLSCEQCQQRKTKCDKSHPCGSCQRANLDCTVVQRRRLPRGRTRTGMGKGTSADLKDHVARLESLLSKFKAGAEYGNVSRDDSTMNGGRQVDSASLAQNGKRAGRESDSSVWSALSDQVVGIREVLEEDFPDEDSGFTSQTLSPPIQGFDIVLFGTNSCTINPSITEPPTEPLIYALLSTYLQRFDPIFKVVHVPSLRRIILLDRRESSNFMFPALEALKFAVYFAAVCTFSEPECQQRFQEGRDKVSDKFRLATEVMLCRASLQTTKDITVLQAFAIYLAGRRSCFGQRNISLLVATAIRIGQTIGLDLEDVRATTPFQLEMRRRLWYSICILDMQAAFDGGSRPVIAHSGILGRPPFCISDADISPIIKSPTVELGGFTDMSFSSMTHQALICWRKLTHAPTDSEGQPIKLRQGWSTRSCIVKDWEQKLRERYLQYCDASQPFQLFTKYVGEGMIVTMQLLERRPLHGFLSSGPPPADGYDLLKVATDVLEASLLKQTDQSLTPWSWFSWAKWYALAVALSELCGHTQGLQVEKAWIAVEASFSKIMDLVVDDGLCKSLEKLMAKARSVRDSGQTSLPSLTPAIEKLPELFLEGSTATSPGDYRSSYPDDGSRSEQAHSYGNFNYDKGAPGIPPRPTQQLLTTEVNDLMQTDWIQEPDAMSWANWEQFMTDVSEFDAPQTLDTVFWGQSS